MFEAVDGMREEHADLERRLALPETHADQRLAKQLNQRYAELTAVVTTWQEWLRLGGDIEASGTGLVLRALSLTVDGSAFAGTLSLTRAVGGERGRLFADLTSDALALDRLPDLSGVSSAAQGLDLDLALAARAVTMADAGADLAAGRLGPIAAGNLVVKLVRTGDDHGPVAATRSARAR